MHFKQSVGIIAAVFLASCGGGSGPSEPTSTATGAVSGVVRDDAGSAVAGASVQLSSTGHTPKSTTTASDGAYSFSNVSTGIWQVAVTPPDGYTGGSFPTVTVAANQQASVDAIVLTKLIPGQVAQNATVTIYQSAFAAQSVTIKAGGSVTWRNIDDIAHTATGSGFDTGALTNGQSSTKTFAATGTYTYICSIHPTMTGKVVVVQ